MYQFSLPSDIELTNIELTNIELTNAEKTMSLPKQMRCIDITEHGSTDNLVVVHRPLPELGDSEVLIKVAAAGVNRPDIFQRKGLYPPPAGASDILGLEVAGEIISVGSRVTHWQVGQPICALLTGGGYSEYALAHQDLCLPVPKPLSLIQAAALPETFLRFGTTSSNVRPSSRVRHCWFMAAPVVSALPLFNWHTP